MADDEAEEIAAKVLDIIGGIGGAVVGVIGGGSDGAKGVQTGTTAIKDIVAIGTGSAKRKRAESDAKSRAMSDEERKLEERRLALEERKLALQEQEARLAREKDKIRDFDAPMYPAAKHRAAAVPSTQWRPSTLDEGDRIVEIYELPEKMAPLVSDARDSLVLRRGDSREVVLVDRGPHAGGAAAPTKSEPTKPTEPSKPADPRIEPERPALVARRPVNVELAGDLHNVDAEPHAGRKT